ncbi:hypothetical protein TNCT_494051 [Trichonephila clavata]|uniref:Uncharacterized protein n=1 Tax=Trichonephila clavata TaxID=2740835 RepID=A0A8X6FMH5_TRICU|nr:hypothetical protein TNCT_494051 [Trichonephila clavata]
MKMNKVSILLFLFYGINLTSGATLRKVELSNEAADVTGVELNEDSENKPKSHTSDELNHENADLESYTSKLIPIGEKSPHNTSKTFFSSSQFFRIPRKMWSDTRYKDWNGLQTKRVRNLKSHFDFPSSSSRTTMKYRNHYKNVMHSRPSDDRKKYLNSETDQIKSPSLNTSSVFSNHSNFPLIKRNGRIYGLNYEDYWYDLTKFKEEEPEEYWELPNTNKDDLEDYSYDADYSDDAEGDGDDYSDDAEGDGDDYSDDAEGDGDDYSDDAEGDGDDYSDDAEGDGDDYSDDAEGDGDDYSDDAEGDGMIIRMM